MIFFETQAAFREWLKANHKTASELLVGFHKVGSGKPSMTWPQSVDQALCFGWIDGVRKSLGEDSYTIRFTPRKKSSIWSNINIKKVQQLTEQKLMQPAGLEAFGHRREEKSGIYSFEKEAEKLDAQLEKKFKANKAAWAFFTAQAPSYQKQMIHRVTGAKREETRLSRLEKIIAESAKGKRVP